MKKFLELCAALVAANALFLAVMGVLNIIFDLNLGLRGSSSTPLPTDPVELAVLIGALFFLAGLLWLCAHIGRLVQGYRKKPAMAFGLTALTVALLVVGGNAGLTYMMGGPVQRAVEMNNTEQLTALLQKKSYEPETLKRPLYFSLKNNNLTMAESLVAAGADVDAVGDDEFETPLLLSAGNYFSLEAIKFLIDNGADPNVKDNLGRTALITAVTYRDGFAGEDPVEIVQLLDQAGADLEIEQNDGETALAIAQRQNKTPIVNYLEQARKPQN